MTFWQERVKANFMGDYDEDFGEVEHFIPVAGAADDPGVPIEDGFFVLSKYVAACLTGHQGKVLINHSDAIKGIFEPVINDVEMLIDEQMFAVEEKGFSAEVSNTTMLLVYLADTRTDYYLGRRFWCIRIPFQ